MDKFNEKDLEFLNQGELFYSGGQPTWSDKEWDTYRSIFESKYGPVTNYMKSLNQGAHVDHRASGRFKLDKVAIDFQYVDRCHELMDADPEAYWMYKYDGSSVVAYYNNGKLVQVCTKSAIDWGIDRTTTLGWLFPQQVDPCIDSIQGEAVVIVSAVGGAYAARSKANGLINSKYKADEIKNLINIRAFKVGFVDLDPSISRMINALVNLPIPAHGKFQVAKRLTKSDVTESEIGSEDILYDGIVRYSDNGIIGYKRHSSEHIITKITNIEWNLSNKGLMVPKFVFDKVVFNAEYDENGNVIGGINVSKASCGSANRLFTMKAGVGAIVEVYRANSTIPQVSKVIEPSEDYCLDWLDKDYYTDDTSYEFRCGADPWKVIANKGFYPFGGGIKSDGMAPAPQQSSVTLADNIQYWYGVDSWAALLWKNPREFAKFVFYKTNSRIFKKIDNANLSWYLYEISKGDPKIFDEFAGHIANWVGNRESIFSIKDEWLEYVNRPEVHSKLFPDENNNDKQN